MTKRDRYVFPSDVVSDRQQPSTGSWWVAVPRDQWPAVVAQQQLRMNPHATQYPKASGESET